MFLSKKLGEMAERFKAQAWKACILLKVSWVRIPLSPPLIFLIFFLITSEAHAKKWKAFLCNYKDGVLENASDPCEKEANKFKIYLHKYSFKSEKLCDEWILEASSTSEAKEAYPVDIWIIGCDKNW